MKKINKLAVTMIAAGVISAPVTAHAFSDMWFIGPTQAANIAQWASDKAAILAQMAKDKLETLQAFASTEMSINSGMESSSTAISATLEKQTGAMKEIAQGKMNYDATVETARGAAEAEDLYGDQRSLSNMCDAAESSKDAARAATTAGANGKALSAAFTRRDLYASKDMVREELLNEHNKKYCSDDDAKQGRCTVDPTVPVTQQNADLNAGSLLAPANGTTYSKREAAAAKDFIATTTSSSPPGTLPKTMERGPHGKAYVLASMVAAAQNSVAHHSLSQIWAANAADEGLSAATDDGAGQTLSLVGVMKRFVYTRFVEPEWKSDLVQMDTNGLLKEIAILLAGQNWMDYQAYLQAERMEAVVATQLAISARDHNERRLAGLRSRIGSK